jgi:hypothetical protein
MANEESKEKQPNNFNYRRYLRFLGITIGILLVLQVTLYFSSDFLLRNYLKEKVREQSDYKYEIDFEKFRISLLQRGIYFYGFSLIPVEEKFQDVLDVPYYKIELPEVSVLGINYLFRKKELVLGKIYMTNPDIDFRFSGNEETNDKVSALLVLQDQIKKSFLGSSIQEIRIKNLEIGEGDVLLQNFIAQRAIKAENAGFKLSDVQLLQRRIPETPFNAAGFSFQLQNFEILLADSIHTIQAGTVHVSSINQQIHAEQVKIIPDFGQPAQQYFQVALEELELTDADINKVFYTAEVEVGKLVLDKPDFALFTSPKVKKEEEVAVFDLYELIKGLLESISVQELVIGEGKFIQHPLLDPEHHNLKAGRIDFKMQDFYVGPDESRKKNQFFYADNAAVELFQVDMALGDQVHWIQSDYVKLSSFEDVIQINNLKIFPLLDDENRESMSLLNLDVAELRISESQLKKIYNEGILDIEEIVIDQPQILLRDVGGSNTDDDIRVDYQAIVSDYLKAIYVKRFEIREGSLVLDNNLRSRQDSLSFGKVSLVLENFALDDATESSADKGIFWAENLQLQLSDYALKLSDDLHMFKASKVILDTKRSEIKIDGFTIKPFHQEQIQQALDRYDKTLTLDIFVPHFLATGVDIPAAYFNGTLKIKQIRVPSPKINLIRYRSKTDEEAESLDQKDVLKLITSYFSSVSVDSLILQKGSLNYENNVGDRMRTFSEENVSVAVKNFFIDRNTDAEQVKFLFSEEVDLSLNNYVFNLADGKYTLTADRINFNTAQEEINCTNVRLNPSRSLVSKSKVSAIIPRMSFKGVDLEAFLFDNTLSLERVRLSGSRVNILINNDLEQETAASTRRQRRGRTLPKNIEIVRIDTVDAENAILNLSLQENGVRNELINSGINLRFYEFMLDSARIRKGEIPGFFTGMALGIDEFWLNLKDSLHQITFSKVELDTRYEGVMLNNFRIIPRNLSGKPGIPVFSGHIPTVLMKINSLSEIQSSKDLWIKELRLFKPDIEVFVDQVKAAERKDFKSQSEISMLENLRIDDFEIIEGNFTVFDKATSKAPQAFNKLNLELGNLEFELDKLQGLRRKDLLEKDFKLSFPNFNMLLKDSLNRLAIGMLTLTNKEIRLENVQLVPRYGKFDYTRRVGVQTDVAKVQIEEIRIRYPDLEELMENRRLIAPAVEVYAPNAELFRDKRYTRTESYRYMPQALMQNAGVEVVIDSLMIRNGKVTYSEFPEKGMVPGNIFFTELQVGLYPFHLGKADGPYPIKESFLIGNMNLNGMAPLSLQGRMFFERPYPMHINAQMGAFDLDLINSILESNAFVRVTSGQVRGADWSFVADDREAIGQMTIIYDNLSLELLDERTLETGRGRKGILTFVLNTFAVKSQNPRKILRKPLTTRIYEPRDSTRFVFNYWWKASLSGLKGSLGLGQPKVPRRKED